MSPENEPQRKDLKQENLADAHTDIGFGNDYRIEYIKHLVSIATGVFVFSITFLKDFVGLQPANAQYKVVLLIGWFALLLSIIAGIIHMRYWAMYYISWGTHYEDTKGREFRRALNPKRKAAEAVQFFGFGLGLLFLLAFAASNLYSHSAK